MMNNESAFPLAYDDRAGAYPAEPGMTLRDYFAGKAMAGFIAEPVDGVQEAMFIELSPDVCKTLAESAYLMAAAMLAARTAGD